MNLLFQVLTKHLTSESCKINRNLCMRDSPTLLDKFIEDMEGEENQIETTT